MRSFLSTIGYKVFRAIDYHPRKRFMGPIFDRMTDSYFLPHQVFIFDCDSEIANCRIAARGKSEELGSFPKDELYEAFRAVGRAMPGAVYVNTSGVGPLEVDGAVNKAKAEEINTNIYRTIVRAIEKRHP